MAAEGLQIDYLCCSVCLDLLKDPVTIPCGHSYCMSCVNTHWDGEVGKQSYSCPQCRQNFTQRPVLVKNTMLAVLMEGLKKSAPPAPPAAPLPPSAAPGEVFCDLCSGREVKAVKSCLQCQVSYCKEHLQPHYDVAALKRHKLVEPTENLQENMCSRHDEVMKMFCRTDQQCICYLCSVDQHKGHHTVTAAAERAEKQRELQAFEQNILQKIKLKEENVECLQQQVKNNSLSADAAMELSDISLKDLLHLLEKRMREVRQQVRSQQEAEEHRVNELQDKVQQELTELRRKLTEVDTLSHTEDHVTFLHKFPLLSKIRETSESVKISQTPPPFKDTVTAAVSKLRSTLEETILFDPSTVVHKTKVDTAKTDAFPATAQGTAPPQPSSSEEWPTLPCRSLKLKTTASTPLPAQPISVCSSQLCNDPSFKTKRDLQKYGRNLTWDSWSLNDKMVLSNQENICVTRMPHSHKCYILHPARFTHFPQVVSKESLTGCRFWEVKLTYEKACTVAVAYKDIRRDGSSDECCFGRNSKSWALECFHHRCVFWHNGHKVEIPLRASSVGVFLDYKAGVLSFYRMDSSFQHIHTIRTSFTQPLVAGVRLDDVSSTAELSKRKFY